MDPLPGPTNLLAAVLTRIESAVRQFVVPYTTGHGQPTDRQGPTGMLELCPDYLDALQSLQRLQTDVALAWDGNLPRRGDHLDPDAYALEVLRAERARLSLTGNLTRTLDDLAGSLFRGCGVTDPLFVLPIDDVDLNPLRSLEILRLLRIITVPRLFMFVLGDVNMVEVVLNLKYSREFSGTLGAEPPQELLSVPSSYVRRTVATVASKAMRKLLPPAQRINLGVMDVDETLEMRPSVPNSATLLRLGDLLAQCPILIDALGEQETRQDAAFKMAGQSIKTVLEFLLFPSCIWPKQEKPAGAERYYGGNKILRMSPRRAADWWFFLEDLDQRVPTTRDQPEEEKDKDEWAATNKKKWRGVIDLLGRDLRSAINEDRDVELEHRQNYREALRRRPSGDWELPLPITVFPEVGPGDPLSTSEDAGYDPARRTFRLRAGLGWRFFPCYSEFFSRIDPLPVVDRNVRVKESIKLREMPSFSPLTTSVFMVFHDLLALGPEWHTMRARLRIYRPVEEWAITEWEFSPTDAISFSWPVPGFFSSWEHDIFLAHWNTATEQIGHTANDAVLPILIYAWIDAAVAVLGLDRPSPIPDDPDALNWEGLSKRLAGLRPKDSDPKARRADLRRNMIEEWLLRLGAFLMPEFSGLEDKLVEKLLCDELREFWQGKKYSISQLRQPVFDWFKQTDKQKMRGFATELELKGLRYFLKETNAG